MTVDNIKIIVYKDVLKNPKQFNVIVRIYLMADKVFETF